MKKMIAFMLCIVLVLSLAGCGNSVQKSDTTDADYEEGYNAGYQEGYSVGYEEGYNEGIQQTGGKEKRIAQFSGSFTATVEQLLPDYYALPGKTIAVVHFFQEGPFLLRFQEDLTDKLVEGTTYVFEFKTFEVELLDDKELPSISDYADSIHVTDYRIAKEDEIGLDSELPSVAFCGL